MNVFDIQVGATYYNSGGGLSHRKVERITGTYSGLAYVLYYPPHNPAYKREVSLSKFARWAGGQCSEPSDQRAKRKGKSK